MLTELELSAITRGDILTYRTSWSRSYLMARFSHWGTTNGGSPCAWVYLPGQRGHAVTSVLLENIIHVTKAESKTATHASHPRAKSAESRKQGDI